MVEDEAVYYIKDLNFKQKKVFSENQTKKNHSSHEKLAIWRRVNKLGEKMATGRTDQIMYTLIRNMRFVLYEMT